MTTLESRLLIAARVLVVLLPVCLFARVPAEAAMSLTVILFLIRSVLVRDWQWTRRGWFRIAVALWLWMLIISPFAYNPGSSFSQAGPWIRFLIFASALEYWVLDDTWMRRLLWVMTGMAVFVACDAWIQYLTGTDLFGHVRPSSTRLSGPFSGLRVGGFIAEVMFPVVLGALAWRNWDRARSKVLWGLMFLLLLSAVFISGERMALLLCLGGIVFAALMQGGTVRNWLVGVLAVAVLGIGALMVVDKHMFGRQVTETETTVASFHDSPYAQLWRSALHLVSERPLLGIGMKNFRFACEDPVLGLPDTGELRCSTHPHNRYLEFLLGAGVPGLVGFVALVAAWIMRLLQGWRLRPRPVWLLGPMTAALIVHLWPFGPTSSFFSNWFGIIFWLCLGWAMAAIRLQEEPARIRAVSEGRAGVLSPG